ncbi:MAG: twin-arginine translocation signal domain-containing protein, partial [Gammaproteobacteria bacterium]|nr:twin-arginine translocation signal domain-containing protein [Gammaproteobacteria bacterium]
MSKLTKKSNRVETVESGEIEITRADTPVAAAISRRAFLKNSSLMAGGAALATTVSPVMMKKSEAGISSGSKAERIKTICTHCAVGCGIIAEVQNGVWTGQEPAFDHPFNRGAHCAKGASIREHG